MRCRDINQCNLFFKTRYNKIIQDCINRNMIENLSAKKGQQFIVRNKDKYMCTYVFTLFSLVLKQEIKEIQNIQVNNINEYIKLYQFNAQVYNSSYMIQNFDYSYTDEYFKLNQHYYNSTLYSIKPPTITYLQKIQIITKIAHIVKHFNDQFICIRTLRPQILSFNKIKSEIDIKIIWLDQGIKLQQYKSETNVPLNGRTNNEIYKYLAPQIRLKKNYGIKADVWSLGIIFYELLFGNIEGIIFNNQNFEINFPINTPKWLQNIICSFLQVDPKKRCLINHCFSYFKSLKCCSETASKLIPKIGLI